jgi:hypothetical protein
MQRARPLQVRLSCVGCRAPIADETASRALCAHCKTREADVYQARNSGCCWLLHI